ncbi:MAG: HD-GYP domain-containing protein, partial [bacterium]
ASISHHHDRYDGTGLDQVVAGSEIPLGARILAVADSFDAMTSNRSYRKAKSVPDSIRELEILSNVKYDREVVHALKKVLLSN